MNKDKLQAILDASLDGKKVIVLTWEKRELMVEQILAKFAGVDINKIREGDLSNREYNQLIEACEELYRFNIYILDINENDSLHSIITKNGKFYDKLFVIW